MRHIYLYFILVAIELVIRARSEVFTSTTHLIQLRKTELELAKQLKIYLKKEYERLSRVEKFLDVIQDELSQAQSKVEEYFSNPINAYLFIKHLTAEWYHIKNTLPSALSQIMGSKWSFPTFEDYIGVVNALLRLQDTYQLNTSHLANGNISLNFLSHKLTVSECYDIGRVAYAHKDFYHTLMWMQEALDRFDQENNDSSINKIDILDYLANATSQQGNVEHALALTEQILAIDPDHIGAKNNKIHYEYLIQHQTVAHEQQTDALDLSNTNNLKRSSIYNGLRENINFVVKNPRPGNNSEAYEIFEKLCRQKHAQLSSKRQARLFCRYRHNNHPYLILGPIKEEQLLDEPVVFLFHGIVSDTDIKKIKALATPKLQRALVRNITGKTVSPAAYRTSKGAWISDKDSTVVARLSQLISALTNLTMETAEDLQIANYGIGGHYDPHFDFYHKTEMSVYRLKTGNRIATCMTYMSDVEWGGATVFPIVGGYIAPKKGSAAFWYNLHASGEVDYRTLHGACPVLIGNKWIANKWIHESGQEFRRRCSLDPMI